MNDLNLQENFLTTDEQNESAINSIIKRLTIGVEPQCAPVAVIVAGQPGSGKTGLIAKTLKDVKNSIALDVDDYRYFHPKIREILSKYPDQLVPLTAQFVKIVSKEVTDRLIEKKYNLVLHKTLKDTAIVDDTILPLFKAGYDVFVRVMVVCPLQSKISALERSRDFKNKIGWCRWVTKKNHDFACSSLPKVANELFKNNYCKALELFVRGSKPTHSILKYAFYAPSILNNSDKFYKSLPISRSKVAKKLPILLAFDKIRSDETKTILPVVYSRIKQIKKENTDESAKIYIDEIESICKNHYNGDERKKMDNNLKLELAKEILARMIALESLNGFDTNNRTLMRLLEEEKEMNKFNLTVINKIINTYGPKIKLGG